MAVLQKVTSLLMGMITTGHPASILHISKIQLVVYYQCCVLIGRPTTRLYVIAHQQRKAPALKTKTVAAESCFACLSCFVSIFLTNQLYFTKTIIPLALMASESMPIRRSVSWAIDSQLVRAQGIIVKPLTINKTPQPPRK